MGCSFPCFFPQTVNVVAHSSSRDLKPPFVGSSILKPDDHVSSEDLDGRASSRCDSMRGQREGGRASRGENNCVFQFPLPVNTIHQCGVCHMPQTADVDGVIMLSPQRDFEKNGMEKVASWKSSTNELATHTPAAWIEVFQQRLSLWCQQQLQQSQRPLLSLVPSSLLAHGAQGVAEACVRDQPITPDSRAQSRGLRRGSTCGRFAGTHGDVLNLHRGGFPRAKPRHTHNTHHAHTHRHHTPHIAHQQTHTTHQTPPRTKHTPHCTHTTHTSHTHCTHTHTLHSRMVGHVNGGQPTVILRRKSECLDMCTAVNRPRSYTR